MKWHYTNGKDFPVAKETPNTNKGWIQVLVVTKDYMHVPLAGICGDSFSYRISMYNKKEKFCIDGINVDNVVCWSYLNPIPKKIGAKCGQV